MTSTISFPTVPTVTTSFPNDPTVTYKSIRFLTRNLNKKDLYVTFKLDFKKLEQEKENLLYNQKHNKTQFE